jgi:hypothetical protein
MVPKNPCQIGFFPGQIGVTRKRPKFGFNQKLPQNAETSGESVKAAL